MRFHSSLKEPSALRSTSGGSQCSPLPPPRTPSMSRNFGARSGMPCTVRSRLGGDAAILHGAQHFQRARSGEDDAQPPAVFEQSRRAFRDTVRRAEIAFVSRQPHALVLAGQRRARAAVGGIAHSQRVLAVAEEGVRRAPYPRQKRARGLPDGS